MKRKDSVFTQVPRMKVKRNRFDLSHEVMLTGKFGIMYPILLLETLPGDHISDRILTMARMAPMLSPVMHKIDLKIDAFFCPARLVYGQKLWEQLITGGQDGTDSPILPFVTPASIHAIGGAPDFTMRRGQLWDYFGLPLLGDAVVPSSTEQILVGPFRAYQKIYSDWLRDPNVDEDVELNLETQGNVSATWYSNGHFALRRRGWRRDYFTSCLPFAQRGTEVLMPLSGDVDIDYYDVSKWVETTPGTIQQDLEMSTGSPGVIQVGSPIAFSNGPGRVENIEGASVANSTVSINDLRSAVALQAWAENSARGGGRYVEATEAHFNIRIPDYTLQRSEYIGGVRGAVQIKEVLATAETEDVPVGDMFGHGISVSRGQAFSYRCEEHGFVMAILTVIPQSKYNNQGIERLWSKHNRFDYAFPELMHLGEQATLSKELFYSFLSGDDDENNETFGYLPRASEYKFKNDVVCGDFRDTLAFWGLARIFTERPALDHAFVTMYEVTLTAKNLIVGSSQTRTVQIISGFSCFTAVLLIVLYLISVFHV